MKKEQGFSLIELSIVLIIIGLLVSGITGGASLINSARVRSTMTEVTNYRIAVNTFYTTKDRYPGDTAPVSANADNKIIGAEMINTWTDLESVDAVDKDYTAPTSQAAYVSLTGLGYTKNAAAGWLMGYHLGTSPYNYNAIALTDLSVSGQTVTDTTSTTEGIVSGATSGNIVCGTTGINAGTMDLKMDDGIYNSGDVVGLSDTDTATTCDYTATTEVCVPVFSIDL